MEGTINEERLEDVGWDFQSQKVRHRLMTGLLCLHQWHPGSPRLQIIPGVSSLRNITTPQFRCSLINKIGLFPMGKSTHQAQNVGWFPGSELMLLSIRTQSSILTHEMPSIEYATPLCLWIALRWLLDSAFPAAFQPPHCPAGCLLETKRISPLSLFLIYPCHSFLGSWSILSPAYTALHHLGNTRDIGECGCAAWGSSASTGLEIHCCPLQWRFNAKLTVLGCKAPLSGGFRLCLNLSASYSVLKFAPDTLASTVTWWTRLQVDSTCYVNNSPENRPPRVLLSLYWPWMRRLSHPFPLTASQATQSRRFKVQFMLLLPQESMLVLT